MQNETRMVNKYELPGINSGMQRMTGHQKTIGANLNDFISVHWSDTMFNIGTLLHQYTGNTCMDIKMKRHKTKNP